MFFEVCALTVEDELSPRSDGSAFAVQNELILVLKCLLLLWKTS